MTKTHTVAVRMEPSLVERVDAHAERLKLAAPGVTITRGDAIRSLCLVALTAVEPATVPAKARRAAQ